MSAQRGRWLPICFCGKPVEGHESDEIHSTASPSPSEGHEETCSRVTGPMMLAAWVEVASGRCTECKRRVRPAMIFVPDAPEPSLRAFWLVYCPSRMLPRSLEHQLSEADALAVAEKYSHESGNECFVAKVATRVTSATTVTREVLVDAPVTP